MRFRLCTPQLRRSLSHATCASVALLALAACQTPRYKEVQKIKPGMDKDDVLQTAGGPQSSDRWHDKDRWRYEDPSAPDGQREREVHFQNGRAVYIGEKVLPVVSAEEQDRQNAEAVKKDDDADAQNKRDWEDRVGAVHAQVNAPRTSTPLSASHRSDRDDERLRESMYGTVDIQSEKAKVAPSFEEIK